jgi:hypothetical protein
VVLARRKDKALGPAGTWLEERLLALGGGRGAKRRR